MTNLAPDLQFRLSLFVLGCRPFSASRGPFAAHDSAGTSSLPPNPGAVDLAPLDRRLGQRSLGELVPRLGVQDWPCHSRHGSRGQSGTTPARSTPAYCSFGSERPTSRSGFMRDVPGTSVTPPVRSRIELLCVQSVFSFGQSIVSVRDRIVLGSATPSAQIEERFP